ncbi:Ppx/GppA phosphatase family protein [Undibacter mobilis]|uniref:Ppx/GppA family phosphatase n=1 Tax=Undibacter mobilis TaxID=2292256 RepID=A0A371B363_9BRAD|nr:Ppx/GppA family phosphatase [Undibacter mobilis]
MSGGAGDDPGLDPAFGRVSQVPPGGQPRWGRRSPGSGESEREAANGSDRGGPTYAALDLGTNNCRLLVARPSGDSFRVIDAFSRIVRLGEGISASGRLSEAAIGRSLEALEICRNKMRNRGVTRARLVATEACRAAVNGEEFRNRVAELLGLELEVINRETEAELAATSCTPLIDPDAAGVVLFDIGGGSSELVRLDRSPTDGRGPPPPRIRGWVSLPHGVVTLAERHGGLQVTRDIYEAMVAEVAALIEPFAREHGGGDLGGVHMLGTSGTVTTIAGVHLDLKRYDRNRIDGCWLGADEIDAVLERLLAMSYEERVASPCIGADRADLVLAGCAILEAIRRAFPCPRLRVADRGLREGMLVQMMREDGAWGGPAAAS